MKRKNEESSSSQESNSSQEPTKKRQKTNSLGGKKLYIIKNQNFMPAKEETNDDENITVFYQIYTEKEVVDENWKSSEEYETKIILNNADKFDPKHWFDNKKIEWRDRYDDCEILTNLGFLGDVEEQGYLVDFTFPEYAETVTFSIESLPKKDDTILVFSEFSKKGNFGDMSDELIKLKITEDAKGYMDLRYNVEEIINNKFEDIEIQLIYFEMKHTSTAMDWYNYFKNIKMMEEDLIKKVWTILEEMGFCFKFPIQKDVV